MTAFIQVECLSKVFTRGNNEIRVLDDVDLEVPAGEFLALMGPSGSGKTTLLNILAAIDHPTSGRAVVDGVEVAALTESQRTAWRTRAIGYIFQFYNLMPVLTAWENVELPLLLTPLSKKERSDHVHAALEAVGLLDRRDHFPRQLSGGQEQRVAIARAIVTDAKILLADEPTGNLDAQAEVEIMELLRALHRQFQKTIVMVTHDASAANYADRVLHLEKGRLVAARKEPAHV
jgi:putative ABC transport system ATP-binding protein